MASREDPAGGQRDLSVLQRWEASGGTWQVTHRSATTVAIDLLTCAAGEVVDRLRSSDPELVAYVADRQRSD